MRYRRKTVRERMADACPRCDTVSLPRTYAVLEDNQNVKAVYHCPRCGYEYPCWWNRYSVGI